MRIGKADIISLAVIVLSVMLIAALVFMDKMTPQPKTVYEHTDADRKQEYLEMLSNTSVYEIDPKFRNIAENITTPEDPEETEVLLEAMSRYAISWGFIGEESFPDLYVVNQEPIEIHGKVIEYDAKMSADTRIKNYRINERYDGCYIVRIESDLYMLSYMYEKDDAGFFELVDEMKIR